MEDLQLEMDHFLHFSMSGFFEFSSWSSGRWNGEHWKVQPMQQRKMTWNLMLRTKRKSMASFQNCHKDNRTPSSGVVVGCGSPVCRYRPFEHGTRAISSSKIIFEARLFRLVDLGASRGVGPEIRWHGHMINERKPQSRTTMSSEQCPKSSSQLVEAFGRIFCVVFAEAPPISAHSFLDFASKDQDFIWFIITSLKYTPWYIYNHIWHS